MTCDEYLAAGLPITPGVIEVTCRHLAKDRHERTGMRWSACGAQAILSLRCPRDSDAWDDFQKQFLHPTRIRAILASAVTFHAIHEQQTICCHGCKANESPV